MATRFNRVFVFLVITLAVFLFACTTVWNIESNGGVIPGRKDALIILPPVRRSYEKSATSLNTIRLSTTWNGSQDVPASQQVANGTITLHAAAKSDQETIQTLGKQQRIVIIGSGPAGLGAARRLLDLIRKSNESVITILEEEGRPGGLASSVRDDQGFLWDAGLHVVFSHYTYFDHVVNMAVPEWNYRRRASFVFMKGSDANRRFIPYPVQNNIHTMDKGDQQRSLQGLEEVTKQPTSRKPTNFDEWLLQKFGAGLADIFMRKYNRKFWTVDTTEMNSAWVGERVAIPDIAEIKTKIEEVDNKTGAKDSEQGLIPFFRFPKYNGTGGLWESTARQLPSHWIRFREKVSGIDIDKKVITIDKGHNSKYTLEYDTLVSTTPLGIFTGLLKSSDLSLQQIQEQASRLVYTHIHVVGIGLSGQPPQTLADKSWVYFPDSDSPFYRVTMFSNFSDDHVPKSGKYWSLMCEITEPQKNLDSVVWNKENLIKASIRALVLYGFITDDIVVSKYYRRLEHGYPIPSLKRDMILETIQPWLKTKGIYSRGAFGGWKYEVASQDHSFMQGVEAVDNFLNGFPERIYPNPSLIDSTENKERKIPEDYVIVIAQYTESLDWVKPFAGHTFVYHKGGDLRPTRKWLSWESLPNIGRESHSYLHHIITNYDQLPRVTVFYPGAIADHKNCPQNPRVSISAAKRGIPCRGDSPFNVHRGHVIGGSYLKKPKNKYFRRSDFTFLEFYEYIYRRKPAHPVIKQCWKGCFAATKAMIKRHPLDFYIRAISTLGKSSNPEEGHYFERLWYHMFHDKT
ncbi:uncharacterized protein LOC110976816 [Acanthaster planci]|uniref:Uncharacterized protein LOC110976816 n=1 Tax=Acanthaster planci TaxID=133434 RepID=A0A8B7Y0S0_ACAPL|nr:uncharacterized protein LOC110976816 [Acanthaster planci]